MSDGLFTGNPPVRRFEVREDVGRVWPPPKPYLLNLFAPLRFCASLYTPEINSFVITNAWTRKGAIRKARDLWFEQVRFATGDQRSTIFGSFSEDLTEAGKEAIQ